MSQEEEALAEARRLVADRQWPFTLKLGVPVEFGKETIEALVFQKGNAGILLGLNIPGDGIPTIDHLMAIASRLCGKSPKVIASLDPDDLSEALDIASGFFLRCRGAGKKLSAT